MSEKVFRVMYATFHSTALHSVLPGYFPLEIAETL